MLVCGSCPARLAIQRHRGRWMDAAVGGELHIAEAERLRAGRAATALEMFSGPHEPEEADNDEGNDGGVEFSAFGALGARSSI